MHSHLDILPHHKLRSNRPTDSRVEVLKKGRGGRKEGRREELRKKWKEKRDFPK
jgi:hypothetical protein